jgi:phosphohistidine swiveling domain-containing protein
MTEPWILPLDSPGVSLEVAGGKGANLARLAGQGFPVPPGFLLTTAAYRAYVAHNGLEEEIGEALAEIASLATHEPVIARSLPLATKPRHEDSRWQSPPSPTLGIASSLAKGALAPRNDRGSEPPSVRDDNVGEVGTAPLRLGPEGGAARDDDGGELGIASLAALARNDETTVAPEALEAASQRIRQAFAAGVLPPELAAALGAAYEALGQPAVAVRSSATAEDLPELSFAGQQDTLLQVTGLESLLEAVVTCWSSLWTARAIGYRLRHAIPQEDLALAIVVQQMVPSEAAGVLFTAHPLSGKRTEMVVEATLGLGEALVAGQVEPDRYRLEATTGRILERHLGAKSISIRAQAGGGTRVQPEEAGDRPALPETAVHALWRSGREVAATFGGPQDIEWAWAGGQLYLLQSRPITSLFPLPEGMGPEPLEVMFSFAAVQGLMGPVTPLGQDAIRAAFAGGGALFGLSRTATSQTAVYAAAERLFIRFTPVLRNRVGRRVGRAALGFVEPGAQQALQSVLDDPRLAVSGGLRPATVRHFLHFLLPAVPLLIRCLLWPEAQRARLEELLTARLDEIASRCAAATTLAQRVEVMEALLAEAPSSLISQFIPRFAAGMMSLTLLNRLADGLPGGEHDVLAMTRGLPHNVTTEMDLALWQVAREIRSDPAARATVREAAPESLAAGYQAGRLPEVAQAAVASFLQTYGARGVGEIDLGRPRWADDPRPVFQALQSYLQIEDERQAPDAVFARGAEAAGVAIERLAEALRATRRGWLKARLARGAARRMRALSGLRESPKFWIVRLMGQVRAMLLDSGRELVVAGLLERPDDVFFLHLSELHDLAAELRSARLTHGQPADRVRRRQEAHAREARRTQVPRLLLSDGQAFYEGMAGPTGGAEGVLEGSPVSPGVVEGRVRVVLDPHDASLAPGEILVCPGTDPAWTPLFLAAGGLVMEVGGLMTHGSVVAREYGIPAVVGVTRAVERLSTGQRVRVDGTAGRVTIL